MRRRTLLSGLLAVGVTFPLLAACGGEEEFAADPNALIIYSSQHKEVTESWAKAFSAKTGIKTQIRRGKDSSMGQQIVEEGASSPADVFLTENSPAMTVVERAKLLAPIDASTLSAIDPKLVPTSKDWTAIAARSTVLVYNPSKLPASQLPKSLMDLQQPAWKDRWGAASGGADFQAIVAGMLAQKGEPATAAWLKGLKNNSKTYQNNIATMKAVNAGEVPAGVIFHYYWYRDQAGDKEGSKNTKLHYFKNQDPGAFVSLSAGGVLKSSKKAKQAQEFLKYVLSPEGQKVLVDSGSMEYAVGKGVSSAPALPALSTLQAPPVDPFTLNSDRVSKLMTDAGIL